MTVSCTISCAARSSSPDLRATLYSSRQYRLKKVRQLSWSSRLRSRLNSVRRVGKESSEAVLMANHLYLLRSLAPLRSFTTICDSRCASPHELAHLIQSALLAAVDGTLAHTVHPGDIHL